MRNPLLTCTLLTGSTGFLGQVIEKEFKIQKMNLATLSRSDSSDYKFDLSQNVPVYRSPITSVIHTAGLAHILKPTASDDERFYKSHVIGMKNLLQSLDPKVCRQFVFISSVSVYGIDAGELISEMVKPHPLTAYGIYKLEAENMLINWAKKNDVAYWILRPPLIVGDKPSGNLKDLIRAIRWNYYFHIQGVNPRKCIISAFDMAHFLAENISFVHTSNSGVYNITDGENPNLQSFIRFIATLHNPYFLNIKLPRFFFIALAKIGDLFPFFPLNSKRLNNLSRVLTFDDQLARRKIKWNGQSVVKSTT